MPSLQLDQEYAEIMKNHPFGIALYHPLSRTMFRPGACGYFDSFGSWNPILQLDDPDSLSRLGLRPVQEELQKAPADESIRWGPKTSEHTKAIKVSLSAGM